MNSNKRYQKITELLSKFKNGEELYKRNVMFNQAIQMMVEGMNEFEVLEQIILASDRTQRAFEDYVNRDTRPMVMHP
jgi:hypothetical protein